MDTKTEVSTCCTCGYQWKTGTHGGHSCSEILLKENAKLREELEAVSKELLRDCSLLSDSVKHWQLRAHELQTKLEAAEARILEAEGQMARLRNALEYAEGFIAETNHTESCSDHNAPYPNWEQCCCGKNDVHALVGESLASTEGRPIPSPDVAELRSQLEAAQSRISVQDEAMQQLEARCAMLEVRAEKWKQAYRESWHEQMTFDIQESDWLARNNNEVLERLAEHRIIVVADTTGSDGTSMRAIPELDLILRNPPPAPCGFYEKQRAPIHQWRENQRRHTKKGR